MEGNEVVEALTDKGATTASQKVTLKRGSETVEVDHKQLVELAQKGWDADDKWKAAAKGRQIEELAQKAIVEGDEDSEFKLYELVGVPQDQINKIKEVRQKLAESAGTTVSTTNSPSNPESASKPVTEDIEEIIRKVTSEERAVDFLDSLGASIDSAIDSNTKIVALLEKYEDEGARKTVRAFLAERASRSARQEMQTRLARNQEPSAKWLTELPALAVEAALKEAGVLRIGDVTLGRSSGDPGASSSNQPMEAPKAPEGNVGSAQVEDWVKKMVSYSLNKGASTTKI